MKELNNETIEQFLTECVDDIIQDFGYLVIPDDRQLNDEARCHLRDKFNAFVEQD